MVPIKVVCFDLGGVLIRICRSWAEACALAGLRTAPGAPESPELPGSSEPWVDERRSLVDRYQRGELPCDAYFAALAAVTGGHYSASEVEAIHRVWLVEEYPGVGTLLDRIRAAGRRTACLSNTNVSHWRRMCTADADAEFPSLAKLDIKLASHELGSLKPDPEIYARAADEFGVRSGEILFFDDLASNVEGARRAGWMAHEIDPLRETASQLQVWLEHYGVA